MKKDIMLKLLDKNWKVSLVSSFIPALISFLFVGFSLDKFAEYGLGIFVLAPFFIGLISSLIKGYNTPTTLKSCVFVTFNGLLFFCSFLVLFAYEGFFCIIMAAPIGAFCAYIGCWIGFVIQKKKIKNALPFLIITHVVVLPSFMTLETSFDKTPKTYSATTSVIVNAPKQKVWDNLVAFKKIESPLPFIFKYGISYPVDSEVKGKGVGAIRFCNFSTGSFVEPVDVWNEPNHLHFYVEKQPIPMKELSPYDIHPKHLHGYFVSTKGEFRLTYTSDGKTKLEGTTWYYNKIYPEFYWSWWTDFIIHAIHYRVLTHIKKEAEKN